MHNSFLFNQHGVPTDAGNDISRQVDKLFDDILAKHPEINPRELSHLFTMSVTCSESEHMLRRAHLARVKAQADKVAYAINRLDHWESGYSSLPPDDHNRLRMLGFMDEEKNITEAGTQALAEFRATKKEQASGTGD